MADNLYDTGAPKRIIVEHRHIHDVRVARRPESSWCDLDPRSLCIGGPHPFGTVCAECPVATKRNAVTITPEFQPVEEKKLLK